MEIWRFKTNGGVYTSVVEHGGTLYFGSWDCHVYAINPDSGKEVWRFSTSTQTPAPLPPAYECFEMEIKKETRIEDAISEEKYASKRHEHAPLSSYHVTSEYSTKSDYKQKSDYEVNFVIFEGVMESEDLWTSDLKALNQEPLMLTLKK
jgi:hypothetical protein